MFRSTRTRRGDPDESAMTDLRRDGWREVDGLTASPPPLVEVRPQEEELAPRAILLSWNRPLGAELPQGVAMEPEIFSSSTRIQPFRSNVLHRTGEPCRDGFGDAVGDDGHQAVEQFRLARA